MSFMKYTWNWVVGEVPLEEAGKRTHSIKYQNILINILQKLGGVIGLTSLPFLAQMARFLCPDTYQQASECFGVDFFFCSVVI